LANIIQIIKILKNKNLERSKFWKKCWKF
jgi:hypothetical protein